MMPAELVRVSGASESFACVSCTVVADKAPHDKYSQLTVTIRDDGGFCLGVFADGNDVAHFSGSRGARGADVGEIQLVFHGGGEMSQVLWMLRLIGKALIDAGTNIVIEPGRTPPTLNSV